MSRSTSEPRRPHARTFPPERLFLYPLVGIQPFNLDRGPFGFSISNPVEAPEFGPMLASGGSGQTDALRLLDTYGRVTLPDIVFFYGGEDCPGGVPFAGLWLQILSNEPIPAIIYMDGFDDGVVSANYLSLGGATLTEADGDLVLSTSGAEGDGFAFRFDSPVAGTLCNLLGGIESIGAGPDSFINMDFLTESAVARAEAKDVSVKFTEKSNPKRLIIVVTDKNGQKFIYTEEDKELKDIKKLWWDKKGTQRMFEINYNDGSKFRSKWVDPPDNPIAGFDLTTNVPELRIDTHGVEDAHRIRIETTNATTVVSALSTEGVDEINLDLLLGSNEVDLSTVDPEEFFLLAVDANGNWLSSTPLDASGNGWEFVDEVYELQFRNAPLGLDGIPDHFLVLGTLPDGTVLQAGTTSTIDPDAVQTMIDRRLLFTDAVDLVLEATGPHISDGVDTATVTITATDRETGVPVDGLEISVFVTEGIDAVTADVPIATPLGGGVYQYQYSSTISGQHGVTAVIEERDAEGSTGVEFLPQTPVELAVELLDGPVGRADGQTPVVALVAARDENGNVFPLSDLNFQVTAPIPFVLQETEYGEGLILLTSIQHGAFDVTVQETFNQLQTSFRVFFPVLAGREPIDNPALENEDGTVLLRLPMELVVADGWAADQWNLSLIADTGLTAIGQVVGVEDADPTDRFTVTGSVTGGNPCTEGTIDVNISAAAPGEPGTVDVVRFEVLVDPYTMTNPPLREVRGSLLVDSITANAPHPQYGAVIPINDDTVYVIITVCIVYKWREGCIMYVRGDVPDGKAQVTKEKLCETHSDINKKWKQCCIVFKKEFCDIIIAGKIDGRDVTGKLPKPSNDPGNRFFKKFNRAVKDAAEECPVDKKCLQYTHVQDYGNRGTTRVRTGGPDGKTRGQFATVRKQDASSRTSPHEIGHLLGLEHVNPNAAPPPPTIAKPPNNLMRPTNTATGNQLNAAQCETARNSAILNDRWLVAKYYYILLRFSLASRSPDSDDDGTDDGCDNCPETANADQTDTDEDMFGDACDNCPFDFNPDQTDTDGNGIGDACEGAPPGACCTPDGQCLDGFDQETCELEFEGAFQGGGTTCAGVECVCPCNADFNGDGNVDQGDLSSFAACWGLPVAENPGCAPLDLDCNGVVDAADFSLFGCQFDGGTIAECCGWLGACCTPDNECLDGLDQETCELEFEGAFQGSGTTCTVGRNADNIGDICPQTPAVPAAPHNADKNRYISFDPNNNATDVAFQVTLSDGRTCWVGEPCSRSDTNNVDPQWVAECVQSATGDGSDMVRDWSSYTDPATGFPVVHVRGCVILPDESYDIRTMAVGGALSAPLALGTVPAPAVGSWADIVGDFTGGAWTGPNSNTNFKDVAAGIQGFQQLTTAAPVTWVDLVDTGGTEVPNYKINFNDIGAIIRGFLNVPYPGTITDCVIPAASGGCP